MIAQLPLKDQLTVVFFPVYAAFKSPASLVVIVNFVAFNISAFGFKPLLVCNLFHLGRFLLKYRQDAFIVVFLEDFLNIESFE